MRIVRKVNRIMPVILSNETRDGVGSLAFAQTFPYLGMSQIRKGYKFEATSKLQTFYDIEVTTELRLSGGKAWVVDANDVHPDDYMEFSVIDKNDKLGLFGLYGLIPGVDILELEKFVRTEYVLKGDIKIGHPMVFEPAAIHGDPVYQGLFMRAGYMSYGNKDTNIIFNLMFYED